MLDTLASFSTSVLKVIRLSVYNESFFSGARTTSTWSTLKPSDCVLRNLICWYTTKVQMISVMAVTNCITTRPLRRLVPLEDPTNLPFSTCMGLNPDSTADGYEPDSRVPPKRMRSTSTANLSEVISVLLNSLPHNSPKEGSSRKTAPMASTRAVML